MDRYRGQGEASAVCSQLSLASYGGCFVPTDQHGWHGSYSNLGRDHARETEFFRGFYGWRCQWADQRTLAIMISTEKTRSLFTRRRGGSGKGFSPASRLARRANDKPPPLIVSSAACESERVCIRDCFEIAYSVSCWGSASHPNFLKYA
jgi:hypothetical protein